MIHAITYYIIGATCQGGRDYYMGCKIPCGAGINHVCKTKELGCWCKPGYAEDEDTGACTKIESCPCKSGKIKYEVGFRFPIISNYRTNYFPKKYLLQNFYFLYPQNYSFLILKY